MASAAPATPADSELETALPGRVYYRHRIVTRVCHWINVVCIGFLIASGLNIFNAHPALYWGQYGADHDDSRRWLEIGATDRPDGTAMGMTRIGSVKLGHLKPGQWRNLTDAELRGLLPQQEDW